MANSYVKSRKADHDIATITNRSMCDFGERQTDKYIRGLEKALQKIAGSPAYGRDLTSNERYRFYPY